MTTSDLIVLHSRHDPHCAAVVDKHFEGYMTLQFSPTSGVYVSYDDETHLLHGAWFWPAYPGPRIRFGCAPAVSEWDHRYIAFNGALAQRWMASGLFPHRPQRAPSGHNFEATFDEMLELARLPNRWRHAKAVNLLEGVLIDLAIDRSQAAMSEAWLESVIERLSGDSDGFEPDYAAIARDCGMALSTLRRRFRDATGTPIHTFALQCRINRARELLGGADTPIKAIAETLGYRDVYYFSQQFHHLVGVSPGAYRRSTQS
ncbi:MAG: AraC family transcriptional regulator [Capsulimonadaceae bacterium]|nr:AraC family transcriptional regulator [Capsulimonadaceae bacterium]